MGILSTVTTGRVRKAELMVLYGPDGVGKSTFAAGAPKTLFLGAEQGTNELDVSRLPGLESLADFKDALIELATTQHPYQTVAIDTADWLEAIIWRHIVKQENKPNIKSIEDFGYGKGYSYALDEWKSLISMLADVREKGINVIILAHSKIKTFQDPATPQGYDRYMLKLHDGAAALLREFVDTVLFANHLTNTSTEDKRRGFGEGDRVLYTERRPGWDAKNRAGLPFQLKFPKHGGWQNYKEAVEASNPDNADTLLAQIEGLYEQIPNKETVAQVKKSVAENKGAADLKRIYEKALKLVPKQ